MNPNGRDSGVEENEKAVLPAPNPVVVPKQHVPESKWPQRYEIERPANATWAKDDAEAGPKTPKTSSSQGNSQSFDLPLQGVRSDDWNSQYGTAAGVGEGGGLTMTRSRQIGVATNSIERWCERRRASASLLGTTRRFGKIQRYPVTRHERSY